MSPWISCKVSVHAVHKGDFTVHARDLVALSCTLLIGTTYSLLIRGSTSRFPFLVSFLKGV